jgi:hypothetical protein
MEQMGLLESQFGELLAGRKAARKGALVAPLCHHSLPVGYPSPNFVKEWE